MFEKVVENCQLYKLNADSILKAEERMGIKFPADLSAFYREYGYGFVNSEKYTVNRLMDPGSCADIRLRESFYESDPDLEMYEEYEDDAIIFFEFGEGLYALMGLDNGKVYCCEEIMADSLEGFLEKITNPDFWTEDEDWDEDDFDEEDED